MSPAVANNITKRSTKQNATQPSLWDLPKEFEPVSLSIDPDDYAIRDLRFPWADGDTSDEAAQRMLRQVDGKKHELIDVQWHKGRAVWLFADIERAWIVDGVVWGHCKLYIGGPYVDSLRAGDSTDIESEKEEYY